ncbi:hypothetical protein WME73_41270 [Sorangium sp. So ce302]|uniref:hypothetical protein n=1 Tax=unclassified Sorangium TaxID=2621164 RepID=UPI003F5E1BAA
MRKNQSGAQDGRLIYDERAAATDRASAVSRIGSERLYQHEKAIAMLLQHGEPALRERAAAVLVALWGRRSYVDAVIHMLHQDADLYCRLKASSILWNFATFSASSREDRDIVLRALAQSVARDEDPMVQAASYKHFLELVSPERAAGVPDELERGSDVDWELMMPYLAH